MVILILFASNCPLAAQQTLEPDPGNASGTTVRSLIISANRTILASEIAARIESISCDMGDAFKAGQPLILLDTAIYRAQAAQAGAEFTAAEKSLAIHRKLAELGSLSELEMVAAEARLDAAEGAYDLRRIQAEQGTISAPYDGRVVKRIANPHEYVTPGQPLVEIIDRQLQLQLHVPSLWLRWLDPGTRFQVRVDETGRIYSARVTRIGAQIDAVSQTLEIRGEISGFHPELISGMSGDCRFTPAEQAAP